MIVLVSVSCYLILSTSLYFSLSVFPGVIFMVIARSPWVGSVPAGASEETTEKKLQRNCSRKNSRETAIANQ